MPADAQPTNPEQSTDKQPLIKDIDGMLAHQNKWRRIMSTWYFSMSVAAIVATASATVLSGFEMSDWATIAGATATALLGIEKTLLLRERWTHHLRTSTALNAVRLQISHGGLKPEDAVTRLAEIEESYADGMPVSRSAKGGGGT